MVTIGKASKACMMVKMVTIGKASKACNDGKDGNHR